MLHNIKIKIIILSIIYSNILSPNEVRCFNISLVNNDAFLQGLEFLIDENVENVKNNNNKINENENNNNNNNNQHNKPSSSPIISKIIGKIPNKKCMKDCKKLKIMEYAIETEICYAF